MIIDLLFALLMLLALIKGFQKGIWLALFNLAGLFIGMAAAIKLSATCAVYLQSHTSIGLTWLPFLSFILVLSIVIALMYIAGKFMTATTSAVNLSWLNKMAGGILYMLLYGLIISCCLFYLVEMKLIENKTVDESHSGHLLIPLAPDVMKAVGKAIPFMKEMFEQLQDFFADVAVKMK